jgi:hypothetical protein
MVPWRKELEVCYSFTLIAGFPQEESPTKMFKESLEVLSMLQMLHLQLNSQFGNGDQSLEWLKCMTLETKSKFEKDWKNHEAELAVKWKKEEAEQEEASKNWKMLVVSSLMLTTWGSTLTALVAGWSNNDNIDSKMSDLKKDLFPEIDAR